MGSAILEVTQFIKTKCPGFPNTQGLLRFPLGLEEAEGPRLGTGGLLPWEVLRGQQEDG